jgi:hypothetical protein
MLCDSRALLVGKAIGIDGQAQFHEVDRLSKKWNLSIFGLKAPTILSYEELTRQTNIDFREVTF